MSPSQSTAGHATPPPRRLSAEQRATLVDAAVDMLVVIDADGNLVHANVQATDAIGWEPGDDPASVADFIHPDDLEEARFELERFVAGQPAMQRHRLRIGRGDGQWTWVEILSRNHLGVEGLDGIVTTARDVTEQVHAERKILESEQRFRSLVSASADAILMVGIDGTVVYRSEHSDAFLGPEASTAADLLAAVHPDDRSAVRAAVAEAARGEVGAKVMVASRVDAGPSYVWYESWIVNQLGVPGVDSLVIYARDVTAQRTTEEALRARVEADELVARISARFVEVSADEISDAVRSALGELGRSCGADRAWIFQLHADRRRVEHAYEWCAPGVASEIENLQGVDILDLPGFATWIGDPTPLSIPSVAEMDDSLESERQLLEAQGIKSFLAQAMFVRGEMFGLLGFDAVREEVEWTEQAAWTLEASANIFGSALRRCEAETALAVNEARFRAMFDQAADGVRVLDADLNTVYASPAVSRITGYAPEEMRDPGMRLLLVHPDDRDAVEEWRSKMRATPGSTVTGSYRLLRSDGSWIHVEESSTNLLHDTAVQGIVINMRDITERRRHEEELIAQARRDPLTGLANRLLFEELLAAALSRAQLTGGDVAVVALDLDRFKLVNESLSHQVGDSVLRQSAARLRSLLRGGDVVARVGSDEFVVLVEPVDPDALDGLTQRVVTEFGEPFIVDDRPVYTTVSIGVSVGGGTSEGATLLRQAEAALTAAKLAGGNRAMTFDDSVGPPGSDRLAVESDLRRAVALDQLRLHYQPIVSMRDGGMVGAEALLRWEHPTRGLLSPASFLEVAEDTGLISSIGAWVIAEACGQLAAWTATPTSKELSVHVNVSVRQLRDGAVADTIGSALATTGIDPARLCVEITESALLSGADAIAELEAIQALGVAVALDDFGTGHSSLSYLRRLAIDVLKIDREFVDGLTGQGSDAAIVSAIVGLAKSLGLQTVAEGVETEAQAEALRELGCDHAQGFWYARPLPVAELDQFVRRAETTTADRTRTLASDT